MKFHPENQAGWHVIIGVNAFGQKRMQNCYKIISRNDANKYIIALGDLAKFELSNSLYTRLYHVKTGELVLIPTNDCPIAFIFDDEYCYNSFSSYLPIPDSEMTFYDMAYLHLKELPPDIDYFLKSLSSKENVERLTEVGITSLFDQIYKIWNSKTDDRMMQFSVLSYAIVLIDYYGRLYNGEIFLETKYGTFNPYLKPYLVIGTTKIDIFSKLLIYLKMKGVSKSRDEFFRILNWSISEARKTSLKK